MKPLKIVIHSCNRHWFGSASERGHPPDTPMSSVWVFGWSAHGMLPDCLLVASAELP